MTATHTRQGGVLHFPPQIPDVTGQAHIPSPGELAEIAASIQRGRMPLFTKQFLSGACKKQHNPRWQQINCARLLLARLCIDQMLSADATRSPNV